MKRLKSSLLPLLLALLAIGTFLTTRAVNKDNQEGSFTPEGETEAIFTWTYHNDVSDDGTYNPNFRIQLTDAGVAKGYTSVLAICQIWKAEGGIAAEPNIINQSDLDNNHAAQGYCTINNLTAGKYFTKIVVKLNPGSNEAMYILTLDEFEVSGSVTPAKNAPTISISNPTYTYVNPTTVKASITINYENPDEVAIQGIRVGAVGNTPVDGKEYRHDWNKTEDGTGDIVWGDIMLPADQATGSHTVSFDMVNLPENTPNIGAWFKAYIIPETGGNIAAAEIGYPVSTVKPAPTEMSVPVENSYSYATVGAAADYTTQVFKVDNVKYFDWNSRIEFTDENRTVGKTIFAVGDFAAYPKAEGVTISNVKVNLAVKKADGSVLANYDNIIDFNPSEGQGLASNEKIITNFPASPEAGYSNVFTMTVTLSDGSEAIYNFVPLTYNAGQNKTQPTLTISAPSYTYVDDTTVKAQVTVEYHNPDGIAIQGIRVGAVGNTPVEGKEYARDWRNPNGEVSTDIIWGSTTLTAPVDGVQTVEFTLNNLPEAAANTGAWFKAYIMLADVDKIIYSTPDQIEVRVSTVKPENPDVPVEPTLVKSENRKYRAAEIEENEVTYTYPQSIIEENGGKTEGLRGMSGSYVYIVPAIIDDATTIYSAPEINYTIGNDADGYIHVTIDNFDTSAWDAAGIGYSVFMVINNNQENRNQPLVRQADGTYRAKSTEPLPNERTISYYLRINVSYGGEIITRTHSYYIENVTAEMPEKSFEDLASAALGTESVSGQIYTCQAHDSYTPVMENESYSGYWLRSARPVDFCNTDFEEGKERYFSPEFQYIIANDASSETEDNVYVAVKFWESEDIVIPTDFKPVVHFYDPAKENVDQGQVASLKAGKFLSDDNIVNTIDMERVPGMVNTYQAKSTVTFPKGKRLAVGFKFQYWSIVAANGYSSTAPRYYEMSDDDTVVTGIEETVAGEEAAPALCNVYNLQGMAVRVNVATGNALEGLPAGIYIVNGKKYAVR